MRLRIVTTGEVHPHLTAAIDEVLLRAAGGGKGAALHLYMRSPPAVSYGYFGRVRELLNLDYCIQEGIVPLRRLSGGGAIYTDEGQLIYALAAKDELPPEPQAVYEMVCGGLAEAIHALGTEAEFKPPNDVQIAGRKVSGSAIARRYGGRLIHGTVIMRLSRERVDRALKIPRKLLDRGVKSHSAYLTSLEDVVGPLEIERVKEAVVKGLTAKLGAEPYHLPLSSEELAFAQRLMQERYSRDEWNMRL
ncbi:MAG: biotin/lipoate A/B protein ligase family protein [Candidatus Thermoplasmatota archaeon]